MKLILFVDTSGFDQLSFSLLDPIKERVVSQKKVKMQYSETENTIEHLSAFLKISKVKIQDIEKIILVSGPGSFTGLRVGFAHALAFSFALKTEVYLIEKEKVPSRITDLLKMKLKKLPKDFNPEYGAEPNITIKKPAK